MTRALVASLALIATSSCGVAMMEADRHGYLKIVGEPATARVVIDERNWGSAARLARFPARLASGVHRVSVEAPGFYPHDFEVTLAEGQEVAMRVRLRPEPTPLQ